MRRLLANTQLNWITMNARGYYSLFYIVTALAFAALAVVFILSNEPSIVDIWPGPIFWTVAYSIVALTSIYLGFTIRKDESASSVHNRLRVGIVALIAGCSFFRGFVILILFGNVAGFVLQLLLGFFVLWTAPLLFFLPTEIDEYVSLRDRVDELDAKVTGIIDGPGK